MNAPFQEALADSSFAARAEKVFLDHRDRFQAEKTNVAIAWQFGRACFDWAEYARDDRQRAEVAQQGIAACRHALTLDATVAGSHYYLALNLGQLARTKSLGALKIVGEMERAFKKAIELEAKIDFAGPHRSLGLLYAEAPGWPASIGNRSKARHHLEKAVELSPQFPGNRLELAEACLKWNDKKGLHREIEALKELWPRARKEFSGQEWAEAWGNWDKRWAELRTAIESAPAARKRP